MNNEAEINVEIPEITAMFVGTKGKYGFAQVVDDFPNAKEVRILTYSRIGYGNNNLKLRELQTLSPETKLCIIVALPGLKNPKIDGQYEHNQFREDSIVMELGKIKQQFDISQYSSKDVEMYVCFKNHAKLIGTENVLYIGSANYSDNSVQNYEAGMIIRDKSVIKEIYEKYFDEIVAVRYYADEYDTIRLQIQHHENSTQHTDSADKKVIRSFKCQLADFHDIACNARQQLSCAGIIKKAEGHFFHMSEQIATHIVLNAGAHHMTIIVDRKKQTEVYNI